MLEVLEREMSLACSPEHAFAVFTGKLDIWWPRGHRRHRDGSLRLDARTGGRLIDTAPDGTEWIMGAVTEIEPPHRLVLDWFPGSPSEPTRAEVTFHPAGDGTLIRVSHTALTPEAISIWPDRIGLFAAGWTSVLAALASFIEDTNETP